MISPRHRSLPIWQATDKGRFFEAAGFAENARECGNGVKTPANQPA
jgi:hypothetical protein